MSNIAKTILELAAPFFRSSQSNEETLKSIDKVIQEEVERRINEYDAYVLVSWPESQEYMEEEWFDEEAVLHLDEASAYFIPLKRTLKP